ncbi:tRNA (adenosine(37)-N6)-threonylcarbamoyltransferase complex ATPase subunit type 1 TsaE [Vogesella sp. LIG4]|uniref:tRNA (adenosine(37)-N6)-threonylcarbamoyltransferase complex ATPase subunit type 1 TsaE n=1 Tax=Vogesella sp. LIG4 TaxID=1192162 RepID=UPI0008200609|nr:tRNA (adenosine(37)-N6)-threonylcarbamoyltransferase complex ATPase subunit type 1 TsaE [Vogesella sp. LIG4]SCK16756.1 tRNA threonylcarbamoyladenosine biosynthesis protein TsaE [Vogesella sp. LIG4]
MATDHTSVEGYLADEAATLQLGRHVADCLQPGLQLQLAGDLGAGKTTFTRGLLRALGHGGRVKSPTYTLVESYPLPAMTVHHFDLYRFSDPQEWYDAGFADYLATDTLCIVEWPQKADGVLPVPDLTLELQVAGEGRNFRLVAHSETGTACLTRFQTLTAAG